MQDDLNNYLLRYATSFARCFGPARGKTSGQFQERRLCTEDLIDDATYRLRGTNVVLPLFWFLILSNFQDSSLNNWGCDVWADNETSRDFLNFSGVADTVAEIIVQAQGRPISIGISGAWGVGKSSMIKLTQAALSQRPCANGEREFIFVEFNAWLYQGYDDARAALMDVVATKLEAEAENSPIRNQQGQRVAQAGEVASRSRTSWRPAAALALGLPPIGLVGDIWNLGQRALAGNVDGKLIGEAQTKAAEATEAARETIKSRG